MNLYASRSFIINRVKFGICSTRAWRSCAIYAPKNDLLALEYKLLINISLENSHNFKMCGSVQLLKSQFCKVSNSTLCILLLFLSWQCEWPIQMDWFLFELEYLNSNIRKIAFSKCIGVRIIKKSRFLKAFGRNFRTTAVFEYIRVRIFEVVSIPNHPNIQKNPRT